MISQTSEPGPQLSWPRFLLVCVISAGMWALLAWTVGRRWIGPAIWFGVSVAPIIGVVIGSMAWRWRGSHVLAQVAISLVLLYLASALFGIAMGIGRALTHPSPNVNRGAVIIEMVNGVLFWLTLSGAVLVLWPATWVNARVLWSTACSRRAK